MSQEMKTVQVARHDELDAQFAVVKQRIRDIRSEEQEVTEPTEEQRAAIEAAKALGITATLRKPGIGKVTNGIAVQEALNLYIETYGLEDELAEAMAEVTDEDEAE